MFRTPISANSSQRVNNPRYSKRMSLTRMIKISSYIRNFDECDRESGSGEISGIFRNSYFDQKTKVARTVYCFNQAKTEAGENEISRYARQ